jgi:hypothetical protein
VSKNITASACISQFALISVITCICWASPAYAQDQVQAESNPEKEKLFASQQALEVTLHAPWRDIVRHKQEQDPYPATIEFSDSLGQKHSIPLTVARRGVTRQTVCKFPPIRLRFDKESVKGTIFRGQKSLKVVTHCDKGSRWEQYYLKEMLAYRMYNLITERSFRVRPLSITYIDSEKNSADDPRFAFLIEDDSDVAKRNELKTLDIKIIQPTQLESLDGSRLALFQFMIGNADWSALKGPGVRDCCHNAKLIGLDPGSEIYAVPYDFDASGLVDAHYAVPNAGLPIRQVTQRLYRGFCVHNPTLETARQEFLAKEQGIYDFISGETRLKSRSVKVANRYLDEFFDILKNDYQFDKYIIQRCRK